MDQIWQDREIRFDVSNSQLLLRKGETAIEILKNIEDTKGNPDEPGMLKITNLRLIWYHDSNSGINLSIGYDCISNFEVKVTFSSNVGSIQSLHLRCKFTNSKFEFIFSSPLSDSQKMYSTYQAIFRSYEQTKLYRDLKLRGAIIQEKSLILLPLEKIVNKYNNVWNLSADQGNVGTFIVTNVRIVWFANLAENFNVSVPYIQIKIIKKRESKFGPALVIDTNAQSGGYVLGFQCENLEIMLQELTKLHKINYESPIFGVDVGINEKNQIPDAIPMKRIQDDVEIVDTIYNEKNNNIMNYMTPSENIDVINLKLSLIKLYLREKNLKMHWYSLMN